MRAAVLICLTMGLAMGSTIPGFYEGLEEGKKGPWFCLNNPAKCGETLGQMWKIANSAYETGQKLGYQPWTQLEVQLFLQGLTTGLRATNLTTSACVDDFQKANYDVAVLYETVWEMIYYYYYPISLDSVIEGTCAATYLWALPFFNDCNFNALLRNLQNLSAEIIQQVYFRYMCEVNTAVANVLRCERNYNYCGYNIGYLIKTFLNWSI